MISIVKVIVEYFHRLAGKRGELRYGDILPAPKFSSSCMVLKYLSSRVLLFRLFGRFYSGLFRVSMDLWRKPVGDETLKSSLRADTRGQAIFELDNKETNRKTPGRFLTKTRGDFNGDKIIGRDPHVGFSILLRMTMLKIGSFLDDCLRNRGMTINNKCCNRRMALLGIIFSLLLLFPNPSYSATYFLPDAQWDGPINVSIDSRQCELAGYTYYSSGTCPAYHNQETCIFNDKYLKCDATGWCVDNGYMLSSCTSPKSLSTPCPSNGLLYKYCVCPSTYKYACSGTGYSSGNGTACDSKYTKCNCSSNYTWSGSACVCSSDFKYSCSGTGYSSGSGTACGGKYKSCNCSTYYSWSGSACTHTHSYVCPSGYKESNSGMISPTSTSKVCALSGCSSTSGICYKEGHSHSYSCTSGYSSSCTNGYSATASKICSCGASSGTCYKCCSADYKYTCTGTGYSGGSGTSCNSKYTACNCASGYTWNGSGCVASCSDTSCKVGHILYSDGTCCKDKLDNKTAIGIVVKDNAVVLSQMRSSTMTWASSYIDVSGLTNYTSDTNAKTDFNGKSNTTAIVAAYSSDTTSNNTAKYCNSYSTTGTSAGQWYLPAYGELYSYVYGNYSAITTTALKLGWGYSSNYYWSSSEESDRRAWLVYADDGTWGLSGKTFTHFVSCLLPINVSNGVVTPCSSSYQYTCSGPGESGSGTACGGLYTSCNCAIGYEWNGSSCVVSTPSCSSSYKYTCSGTGYSGGSGTACDNKYTACNCATNYTWNGSACVCDSSFQYACNGVGEVGSGTSCGGKYTACVCTSNYVSFCDVTFCS